MQLQINDLQNTIEAVLDRIDTSPLLASSASVSKLSIIEARVADAMGMRSEANIEMVYKKYANDIRGVTQDEFFNACQEIRYDLTSRDEIDEIFNNMDMNSDGYLDWNEFRRAVGTPSSSEQFFSQTMPLSRLILSAIPKDPGRSPLEVFMDLPRDELSNIAQALTATLENMLAGKASELKQSYVAARQMRTSVPNTKFAVVELKAGTIADYHKGLSSRVGENQSGNFFLIYRTSL